MNGHKLGLALGGFLGLWHAVWSVLVAVRLAKPLMDFVLWLHFLDHVYGITQFNFGKALLLIVVTSVIGYIVGRVFAVVWNWVNR